LADWSTSSAEDIAAAMVTDLNDPLLTSANVLAGAKNLFLNQCGPRIIVVPRGGPLETPDNPGHGKYADTKARIIAHRVVQYHVYCHGVNGGQAEQLLHQVIRVLRNRYLTAAVFGQEEWIQGDPETDAFNLDGQVVRLAVTLRYAVYDIARPLTALTASPKFQNTDLWGANEEDVSCNPPEEP
jgi:hypothetical protein